MNGATVTVLLVEDNPGDARLVGERLRESTGAAFHLECTDCLSKGIARLAEGGIDVLLLDLGLPDSQGLETFTRVHAAAPAVPVVVLSGGHDEQRAIEAVQAGAQDYLVKGPNETEVLSRALRYAIERKRAEEQIRRLNTDLEKRVVERTAELEAANHELESFAYAISHDLRSPLRAVNAFAEMLIEDYAPELPTEAQRRLRVIHDRALDMGKLLDGLLALSRIGRQCLKKVRTFPGDLVNQALEELHAEIEGRKIEMIVGDLPPCQADSVLLKQVFVNLLSNALKYTRKKDLARIELGARNEGETSVYYVRDNGAGFDMRYADQLFGVFQRLHRADEFDGTGVGLSIVQRIIHRHGGSVWAQAAVDRGATFYFTLGASC